MWVVRRQISALSLGLPGVEHTFQVCIMTLLFSTGFSHLGEVGEIYRSG
jgi:hypothetical protein